MYLTPAIFRGVPPPRNHAGVRVNLRLRFKGVAENYTAMRYAASETNYRDLKVDLAVVDQMQFRPYETFVSFGDHPPWMSPLSRRARIKERITCSPSIFVVGYPRLSEDESAKSAYDDATFAR